MSEEKLCCDNLGLEEVVLYDGSLEELNSRLDKQYSFAESQTSFTIGTRVYRLEKLKGSEIFNDVYKEINNIFTKEKYAGLVNKKINLLPVPFDTELVVYWTLEGTPVVKKNTGR